MPISIWPSFRVRDGQFFGRNAVASLNFVDALPALVAGDESIVDRNLGAFAVRIADFQKAFDLEIICWPHQTEFGRQFLAFFVRCGGRFGCRRRELNPLQQRQPAKKSFPRRHHFARKASGITSEMWRVKCALILCRTSAGTSAQSLRFGSGIMTCLIPARLAASTFSLMPPTGSTRPRKLISPVIATSERTRRCVKSEVNATTIVTPALGPSLGVAPAGTWM